MGGPGRQGDGPRGGGGARAGRRAPGARALGRRPRRGRRLPRALSERAPPRRGALQEGRGDGEGVAGGSARRAPRGPRRHRALPAGLDRGARSRPGETAPANGCSRSRRASPPPRRRWSGPARRGSWSRAATCSSTATATRTPRPPSRPRWARPGSTGISSAAPASSAPSRSGKRDSDRGRRRCSTRPRRPARAPATAICTRRRSTRGRAATRAWANRDGAVARYARVEAEHAEHSYADDAAHPRRGARHRRRRRGEPPPRSWPRCRPATRRAICSTRRCGGWRSGPGAAGRLDEALHWLDENLRLVPHEEIWYAEGRVQYWKGRVLERQGHADGARTLVRARGARVPAVGLRAAGAQSPEIARAQRRGVAGGVASQGGPRRPHLVVPAARRSTPTPASCARSSWRAWARGATRAGSSARLGLATLGRQARPGAARAEDEDLLWITAVLLDRGGVWSASHSLPRYGVTNYRLEYPKGLGEAKWKLAYPRAFPRAGRQEHQGQSAPRGARARHHARGERVFAAHRIVRERDRAHPDAGQDRQAVRERRAGDARGAARPGQERRARRALPRLSLEALRRRRAARPSPATTRARGRSIAGWASAAISRWTSSWRPSRTTRPATTPSACSPRTSPTPGSTTASRSRSCRSTRGAKAKPSAPSGAGERAAEAGRAGRAHVSHQ